MQQLCNTEHVKIQQLFNTIHVKKQQLLSDTIHIEYAYISQEKSLMGLHAVQICHKRLLLNGFNHCCINIFSIWKISTIQCFDLILRSIE